MSMLAERKRKQKWSLNPRGKHWAEDSNKFGQKLLEKMGWTSGKGLGAKENGITEHIKVSYKNDSKGMGYKESNDQWTEHESNFTALLESLTGEEADISKTSKVETSLEKKSQVSRARVHYHKFTRGKDLSRYSEKDLANIFGKKSLKDKKKQSADDVEKTDEEAPNNSFLFNAGSMADYFKKKLPNFGKTNGLVVGSNGVLQKADDADSESEERVGFGFGFNGNTESSASSGFSFYSSTVTKQETFISYVAEGEEATLKRKIDEATEVTPRKKKKKDRKEDVPAADDCGTKKKKDKKRLGEDSSTGISNLGFDPLYSENHTVNSIDECGADVSSLDVETSTPETPKKKKKSKKQPQDNPAFDLNSTQETDESLVMAQEENSKKKNKKKDTMATSDCPYEVKPKTKKKKRKDDGGGGGIDNPNLELNDTLESEEPEVNPFEVKLKSKKKKKQDDEEEATPKKKRKTGDGDSYAIDNPNFSDFNDSIVESQQEENPYEVKPKKKKKKNKVEQEESKENLHVNPMPECDLMLNVVTTPIIKTPSSAPKNVVKRRKSVRFSEINEERIIPNNQDLQMMAERNELFNINTQVIANGLEEEARKNGTVNSSFDMTSIDKVNFYDQKMKKSKKKKNGLDNQAFDEQKAQIEENVDSISKTLDRYQAEIENDINEKKVKSVELVDIMVGEARSTIADHVKTDDGTKLKFNGFKTKSSYSFFENATGAKKSYKHLIKGDVLVAFKNTNLHEIKGYAVSKGIKS